MPYLIFKKKIKMNKMSFMNHIKAFKLIFLQVPDRFNFLLILNTLVVGFLWQHDQMGDANSTAPSPCHPWVVLPPFAYLPLGKGNSNEKYFTSDSITSFYLGLDKAKEGL